MQNSQNNGEQLMQIAQPWPVDVNHLMENEEWRVKRGEPALLMVVRLEKRYIKSDGWSFGLHSNSGTLWTAFCRAATDEEVAAHEAKKRASAEKRAAREAEEERAVDQQIDDEWQFKRTGKVDES